jgi:hypothetical protein
MEIRVTNLHERMVLVSALADEYERRIMAAASRAKPVEQLSRECMIPLGSCYRRIDSMIEKGLLVVERTIITREGKKFALFRTPFKRITCSFVDGEMSVSAEVNAELYSRRLVMSSGTQLPRPVFIPLDKPLS